MPDPYDDCDAREAAEASLRIEGGLTALISLFNEAGHGSKELDRGGPHPAHPRHRKCALCRSVIILERAREHWDEPDLVATIAALAPYLRSAR